MTTPQARHPQIMALPACTPAERVTWQEIRALCGSHFMPNESWRRSLVRRS